ncbi:Kelch-like protein 20 [Nymphon striatum]|nr:Kelch-like protein 20 [Nymphon striatum]
MLEFSAKAVILLQRRVDNVFRNGFSMAIDRKLFGDDTDPFLCKKMKEISSHEEGNSPWEKKKSKMSFREKLKLVESLLRSKGDRPDNDLALLWKDLRVSSISSIENGRRRLEKFRENPDLNKFEISGFKLENVKKIFDFIYSDSITINKNDLNEIVRLAKIFQLNKVLDNVFNYVKDDMNIENVLSIRDLWMSCDKMEEVKICDQFIEYNFEEISKLQIFKKIEFPYLTLLMKSNNLIVQDEKKIFEIAIEWLNVDIQTRQQFGQQLMEDVRFPLMSYGFLHQISEHEILQNAKSFRRIIESIHYSKEKKLRIGQNILKTVDITPRKYLNVFANKEELNEHLICIGGVGTMSKSIEICSDLGSSWNKFDEIDPGRNHFTSCTYENYIILIGGYETARLCTKYYPKNKRFIKLEPLPDNRNSHVATIINSELFICGVGCNEKSLIYLNLKEQNGKWRNRKSSLEIRAGSTGCSVNSKFYVFGGIASNSCEYYNPQEDHWRPLPKMKEERVFAGSCYDNNKFIYVVGGEDFRNNIHYTSMERFDVEIGQWLTLKSSIGVGRRGLTLTIFKNQLILIGGQDEETMLQNNPNIRFDFRFNMKNVVVETEFKLEDSKYKETKERLGCLALLPYLNGCLTYIRTELLKKWRVKQRFW